MVNVNVAVLVAATYETPLEAIVYTPVTPAILNVSPATGVVCIADSISVVPD